MRGPALLKIRRENLHLLHDASTFSLQSLVPRASADCYLGLILMRYIISLATLVSNFTRNYSYIMRPILFQRLVPVRPVMYQNAPLHCPITSSLLLSEFPGARIKETTTMIHPRRYLGHPPVQFGFCFNSQALHSERLLPSRAARPPFPPVCSHCHPPSPVLCEYFSSLFRGLPTATAAL